jgi:hypothetical protein
MDVLALIIAIIALFLAFLAYQKVGGIGDLKKQTEVLTQIGDAIIKATNSLREKTADVLNKIEKSMRGTEGKGKMQGAKSEEKQEESPQEKMEG